MFQHCRWRYRIHGRWHDLQSGGTKQAEHTMLGTRKINSWQQRRSDGGCGGHHASAERSHSDGFETELGKRDFGNRDEAASSRDGLR